MITYRTGNHWGVTIVREGTQPPDASGHRSDAELVAVVVNGDHALAERICALLNAARIERCPSCDHAASMHHLTGCWYTVDIGGVDHNLVCVCTRPHGRPA